MSLEAIDQKLNDLFDYEVEKMNKLIRPELYQGEILKIKKGTMEKITTKNLYEILTKQKFYLCCKKDCQNASIMGYFLESETKIYIVPLCDKHDYNEDIYLKDNSIMLKIKNK